MNNGLKTWQTMAMGKLHFNFIIKFGIEILYKVNTLLKLLQALCLITDFPNL